MSKKLKAILALLFLGWSLHAQQQSDDGFQLQQLDEVVVSDSRFELKRENSGKTVIKIDSLELSRNQGRSVAEIINIKSGLEITGSRSRQGEVLGVFARGGRGRQVLVIIDGVRVSDPSSFAPEYDLRLLSLNQISSIEILKGAASTLYGTNAATAVINITTKKASASKIAGDFQSSIGTNQTADDQNYNLSEFNNAANISGTLNKLTYAIGFAHTFVDGLSSIETETDEDDSTSNFSTNVQLGYQFTDDLSFRVYANQTKFNTEYDESFGLFDAPYRFKSEQKRVGLAGQWKYNKGEISLNAAVTDYLSDNISAFPGTFEGKNYIADLFTKYICAEKFYTIVGLNYIKDQAEFVDSEDFTIIDPYANVVYVSDFGLNVNGGFRVNNHSEYGSEFVYNINPSFVLGLEQGYFKILGSYATSYITPSLTQLFGEFGANPDLEPESNRTIEGGLEYAIKGLRANAVYFNRKEENFVFFDNVGFRYLNAENTIDAQGVELEVQWIPIKNLRLDANYTFTERKGDNAIRIPKHKASMLVGYNFSDRTFLSGSYSYTGERTDTDFNTFSDVALDPFSLFGLFFSHQLIEDKLSFNFTVDNIFNTSFTEVIGFNTRGRNMRLGMNLQL